MSGLLEDLRAAHQGAYPPGSNGLHAKARIDRSAGRRRPGIHGQQDQRARMFRRMPFLHFSHRRRVRHEHGMRKVAEQLLGEFCLVAVGRNEVRQRAEHASAESFTQCEQRRGSWCETNPVAFQRFERSATRGEHGDVFLQRPPFGHFTRFAIPGFAETESRLLGRRGFVTRVFDVALRDRAGVGQALAGAAPLVGEMRLPRGFLAGALAQRCQLTVECRPLAFERSKPLSRLLQFVLETPHVVALHGEPAAHRLFGLRATGELALHAHMLGIGSSMFFAG